MPAKISSGKTVKCCVSKFDQALRPETDWNAHQWGDAAVQRINCPVGANPGFMPDARFKIAYSDKDLYLMFRVEDRFVRATATADQQAVCGDSCVEFFFTPGPDTSSGYFNLEMNCGGTMLFGYQPRPRDGTILIDPEQCARVVRAASMPVIVEPERREVTVWTVSYRIPLDILGDYCSVPLPCRGVEWRANFYKCADLTSNPHWLAWSPLNQDKPDFHVPESFGTIVFD